jgi:RNA polymerase sigma-70 factor (ECF subfamily)
LDGLAEQLEAFYLANRQEVYTYAVLLAGSAAAAEDALHSAFANVLNRGVVPRDMRPYLFRCVRNAALNERRTRTRESEFDSVFADVADHGVWGRIANREQADALLQTLRDKERECIVLKLYGHMTFEEIGEVQGAPVGTIASWYRRGLERMRAAMEEGVYG